jgi:hypothetical protein
VTEALGYLGPSLAGVLVFWFVVYVTVKLAAYAWEVGRHKFRRDHYNGGRKWRRSVRGKSAR